MLYEDYWLTDGGKPLKKKKVLDLAANSQQWRPLVTISLREENQNYLSLPASWTAGLDEVSRNHFSRVRDTQTFTWFGAVVTWVLSPEGPAAEEGQCSMIAFHLVSFIPLR